MVKFINYFIIIATLCLLSISVLAQQSSNGSIAGKVVTQDQTEPPLATILILELSQGTSTDERGQFRIKDIKPGTYQIQASYVGYKTQTKTITVTANAVASVDFILESDLTDISEVVVSGEAVNTELMRNPIQISSIDVVKLQSESADVVAVLDRTAGVRVRQSGGLGSPTNIQLNGLSGRAVRTYYDGIPLELYGGSIQLNNIPVNAVERVDIYKGVMPVDVGTDALAGGINVISRQVDYDYLDVSYQLGSFNTHIGTLNGSKKLGDKLLVSVSGFYNYSDNNYRMQAIQRTPDFKEVEVEVERFHSAHQSSMISANAGLINVKWADKLSYGISYNQRFDEIQHGVRLGNTAVGEAELERDALIQNIVYQKSFFNNKFDVAYFGNYSIANESVRDSTTNVYDWMGNIIATNNRGVEVLTIPSLREGETRSQVHRLNLGYTLSPAHKIKLSSFLSDQTIEGNDPLAPRIGDVDPNSVPSFLTRSISGISYESKWFDDKLEAVAFGKYYFYQQSTADFRPSNANQIFEFSQEDGEGGYGFGVKYSLQNELFVRASFEQAIRIPTKDEVFGDFLTIEPNFFLEPERSKNLNIGAFYKHSFSNEQYVSLDANWFLRDQSNLIRLEPGRNENDPAQFINEEEANATGLELNLGAAPIKNLALQFSLTLQEVVRDGTPNATNTNGIGNPIPNIPFTFYNISARYKFLSPFSQSDEVSIFTYFNYVDEFDLIFQTNRNEENIIPTQRQVDFGLTYSLVNSGLTFSFQTNNILNTEVFDNYRVPKPGRNFSLKVRYLFKNL